MNWANNCLQSDYDRIKENNTAFIRISSIIIPIINLIPSVLEIIITFLHHYHRHDNCAKLMIIGYLLFIGSFSDYIVIGYEKREKEVMIAPIFRNPNPFLANFHIQTRFS